MNNKIDGLFVQHIPLAYFHQKEHWLNVDVSYFALF